jgi:hypothetical protein
MHGRIREKEGTKNLNVVDVSLYRCEYSNLKLAEATMGTGLGSNEEIW